ncbi:hypothetical protein SK3146_05723 [Paenibacillus konkukensis]|uniref:Uncharacterized protein n=1 Tax=Paenibacillus konkukensis TaxID=2020716 RepID=A0ABY4RVN1_9BACL|nr:hypothetical protein [Paenibacillus konkukensis]UQZ86430.1 hypothetical protein SK3146_05723 [Paenibacillus konkukensis]
MKEEERILCLDHYEHGIVINALNTLRNGLIGERRSTDAVDDLLLKAIDAPYNKGKYRRQHASR